MTAAEVQTLIDDVPCDLCNAPPGLAMYMVAAALIDVSNGDAVPESTQELISEANCLLCLVPPGLLPYVMIQAIRGITTGGGGGTGGVTCSAADPVAAPANACTLHYRTDNGNLWMWDGAAWVALIA